MRFKRSKPEQAPEVECGIPNVTLSSSNYKDLKYRGDERDRQKALEVSTTIYVGNLSFYTSEEQIYSLFSRCGEVKKVVMGLNRENKTPCGFCFVEYYARDSAKACVEWLNGACLDDQIIRTDWDAGFVEGRQYGRGQSGGQVRDDYMRTRDVNRQSPGSMLGKRSSSMSPSEPGRKYAHSAVLPPGFQMVQPPMMGMPMNMHMNMPRNMQFSPQQQYHQQRYQNQRGGNGRQNYRRRSDSGDSHQQSAQREKEKTADEKFTGRDSRFEEIEEEDPQYDEDAL